MPKFPGIRPDPPAPASMPAATLLPRPVRRALRAAGAAALLLHLAAAEAATRVGDDGADAALEARLERWRAGEAPRVQVLDSLVADRIRRLRAVAPSFDLAWRELEASPVPVVIGTRQQLHAALPRHVRASAGWAGITVTWEGAGETERAAVALRVEWLRRLHASYGNPDPAFLEALDGLLIHEIYGHLAPAVRAHGAANLCADPAPGEPLAESCVGRRELALRAELRDG